jgi:hypothetical protein
MWMQTVNKSDTERVWINITNGQAATLTVHYAVHKFTTQANAASVSTNEGGTAGGGTGVVGAAIAQYEGAMIGLAYEDIASGATGAVQAYGYHESWLVMRIATSVTVVPGSAVGPGDASASIGMSSTGLHDKFGPVIALDTVTATLHSLGTVGANWANHCLIRCL